MNEDREVRGHLAVGPSLTAGCECVRETDRGSFKLPLKYMKNDDVTEIRLFI